MMSAQALPIATLRLRVLSRAAATAIDLLSRARIGPIRFAGRAWQLAWKQGDSVNDASCIHIEGRCADRNFELWIPEQAIRFTFAHETSELASAELPDALLELIVTTALRQWLAAFDVIGEASLTLVQRAKSPNAVTAQELLSVALETVDVGSPHSFHLYARLAQETLVAIDKNSRRGKPGAARVSGYRPPFDAVPLSARAVIGNARVPLRSLKTVRPGDIVFFNPYIGEQGPYMVFCYREHRVLRAEPTSPYTLTILDVLMNDSRELLDDDDLHDEVDRLDMDRAETSSKTGDIPSEPTMDADDGGPLDEIPVALTFDVGTWEIPIGELSSLRSGRVIRLDRPMAQLVHVRANGHLIATGELVEIDGQPGIMIGRVAGGTS